MDSSKKWKKTVDSDDEGQLFPEGWAGVNISAAALLRAATATTTAAILIAAKAAAAPPATVCELLRRAATH